jgi:DNA-binding LytR/AlgR family response regulator
MLKAIVVDDEAPAREELIYILEKSNKVKVVGEASYGLQVLDLNRKHKPDIIFLDIKMPGISGIEVADMLLKEPHISYVVFITAYEEYALDAFEVNAIDYILKPISEERLNKTIDRIINNIQNRDKDYYNKLNQLIRDLNEKENECCRISVHYKGKLIPIQLDDILYITVEGKNTVIVSTKGNFQVNYTLNQLEKVLHSSSFFRSHKSFIINIDKIESIEPWFNSTYNVILKGVSEKIPVSRSQSKKFKEIMNIL